MNTFAARNYKFTPGDIVVYVSPKDSTDCLIKRVIGVEGDIISSDRCVLSSQYEKDPHCDILVVFSICCCCFSNEPERFVTNLAKGTRFLICLCPMATFGLKEIIGATLWTGSLSLK